MDTGIETIITELSKIDAATEKIILAGVEEKENYNNSITRKPKDFDEKIESEAQQELNDYEASLRKDAEAKLLLITSDIDRKKSKIQEAYNVNRDKWAVDIFNKILE